MLCKLVYFALYFIILFSMTALFGYSDSSNGLDAYFTLPFVVLVHASSNSSPTEDNGCVSYNQAENTIVISCDDIRLTDIDREISDPLILVRNYNGEEGVWFLNANVVINKDSTLVIDPQDTKWLKISAGGEDAHSIQILGSLKIDSVKVTSWNPEINNYVKFALDVKPYPLNDTTKNIGKVPRPYITSQNPSGRTNITNSEVA